MFVKSASRTVTLKILTILLLLFCFRVAAQLLQKIWDIPLLPEYDTWHSASISYSTLLLSQLIIILLSVVVIMRINQDSYRAHPVRCKIMLWLGWIYFLFMLIRFVLSITVMQSHSWFGATMPAFSHMVLAGFLIVLGEYEKSQLNAQGVRSDS